MLTLFSAPGYKGSSNDDINMGASLEISTSMNITIKQVCQMPTTHTRLIIGFISAYKVFVV